MAAMSNASVVAKGRLSTVASAEEIEELKEVFACFDKDASGAVTTAELALVLKSMNKNYTEQELKKIIGKFDVNGLDTTRHDGERRAKEVQRSHRERWLRMRQWRLRACCCAAPR